MKKSICTVLGTVCLFICGVLLSSCGANVNTQTTSTTTTTASATRTTPSASSDFTSQTAAEPVKDPAVNYPTAEAPKTLKVLAIGNSFSVDAMQYLAQIAKSAGVEEVILGNLYIGGCSLDTHLMHAKADDPAYTYYKNSTGGWNSQTNVRFSAGLTDESWDYITLQQTSKTSGLSGSYGKNLTELIAIVQAGKTNKDAKLLWHMTWAYQQDSTHASFPNYGNSQEKMYNMIIDAVKTCILPLENFSGVIPTGTAIQNARTSFVGDKLTRDGYHLHYTLGRYIAALSWYAAITGDDISDIAYFPSADITPEVMAMAKDAVTDAIKHPWGVTPSTHQNGSWTSAIAANNTDIVLPEDCYESDRALASGLGVNLDNYTLLTYDYRENAYYYCTKGTDVTEPGSGAGTYRQNICTAKIFSKDEIPENSLIICDSGWQYRPELWVSLSAKAAKRPAIVSDNIKLLDSAFWQDNKYFAFNISASPKTDISSYYAAAASHVRIYIPKS